MQKLTEEPLLERKKAIIKINNRIKDLGIESWFRHLKKRHEQVSGNRANHDELVLM